MPISRSAIEDELKSRMRVIGVFAASGSLNRLRYGIKAAMQKIWNLQDWDFKNSTATITTTAGNLGAYDAPTGLVRFASARKVALFGFRDGDVLAPILPTETEMWEPYLRVEDGKIHFVRDPGAGTLTINYLGQPNNSIETADLDAALLLYPDGLNDSLQTLTWADIKRDLPGMGNEADRDDMRGVALANQYWEDSTRDTLQKTISPRGINRVTIDGVARQITILGSSAVKFNDDV